MLECSIESFDLTFLTIKKLLNDKLTEEINNSLEDVGKWMIMTRNFGDIFYHESSREKIEEETFNYDIDEWFKKRGKEPLSNFKNVVKYKFSCDSKRIGEIFQRFKLLYKGGNDRFLVGKLLQSYSERDFWRNYDKIR